MSRRKFKKTIIILTSYLAAAVIVISVMAVSHSAREAAYTRSAQAGYERAFTGLSENLREIDISLQKCIYSTSPEVISSVCTNIFGHASSAEVLLAELPYSGQELEHTAAFINRVGDYAYVLAKNGSMTEHERQTIHELADIAQVLYLNIHELQTRIFAGELSFAELNAAESEFAEGSEADTSSISGSFQLIESEFPTIPTLIYDGPFSEHIEKAEPRLLKMMPQVGITAAKRAAAEFLRAEASSLTHSYTGGGRLPVYGFTLTRGGHETTVEVTRQGGIILNVFTDYSAAQATLSPDEAVAAAQDFLSSRGYDSMGDSYRITAEGVCTISFVYTQEGVYCYPDLVKVSVALDTGEIVGFEARGYIMNHSGRTVPTPQVSEQVCAQQVAGGLSILSSRLAIIPSSGANELLCYEFICEDENSRHYIVYVDALDGEQEKLLILLEDETGTLVM